MILKSSPGHRNESPNHSNLLTLDNLNTVYIHFSGYKRISKEIDHFGGMYLRHPPPHISYGG